MQRFELPAIADELGGQPVEQLGVRGVSPSRPKSLALAARPRPKWYCQTRLTITRVEWVVGSGRPAGQGRPAAGGARGPGEGFDRRRLVLPGSSGIRARSARCLYWG